VKGARAAEVRSVGVWSARPPFLLWAVFGPVACSRRRRSFGDGVGVRSTTTAKICPFTSHRLKCSRPWCDWQGDLKSWQARVQQEVQVSDGLRREHEELRRTMRREKEELERQRDELRRQQLEVGSCSQEVQYKDRRLPS
jgi:hypothetical protein